MVEWQQTRPDSWHRCRAPIQMRVNLSMTKPYSSVRCGIRWCRSYEYTMRNDIKMKSMSKTKCVRVCVCVVEVNNKVTSYESETLAHGIHLHSNILFCIHEFPCKTNTRSVKPMPLPPPPTSQSIEWIKCANFVVCKCDEWKGYFAEKTYLAAMNVCCGYMNEESPFSV